MLSSRLPRRAGRSKTAATRLMSVCVVVLLVSPRWLGVSLSEPRTAKRKMMRIDAHALTGTTRFAARAVARAVVLATLRLTGP